MKIYYSRRILASEEDTSACNSIIIEMHLPIDNDDQSREDYIANHNKKCGHRGH